MRLEVVIIRAPSGSARDPQVFAKKLSSAREALFVDPVLGLLRRGDVVVKIKGAGLRAALAMAAGAVVTTSELEEWEFADARDGGPLNTRALMRLAFQDARAALAALGFVTSIEHGRGYSARPMPMAAALEEAHPQPELLSAGRREANS